MNIEATFRAADQDELEQKLASLLRRCGWMVEKGGPWLTMAQVCDKYKIGGTATLSMRLKRWEEGGSSFPARRSLTGRLKKLQITPELDQWFMKLRQSKK